MIFPYLHSWTTPCRRPRGNHPIPISPDRRKSKATKTSPYVQQFNSWCYCLRYRFHNKKHGGYGPTRCQSNGHERWNVAPNNWCVVRLISLITDIIIERKHRVMGNCGVFSQISKCQFPATPGPRGIYIHKYSLHFIPTVNF